MSSDDSLRAELQSIEAGAARSVPILQEWLRQLVSAAGTMTKSVSIPGSDHLGFMAVQFHAKQLHHAEGVTLLEDHADVSLISRSMLEGLCLLKWAAQDVSRPLRWRMYSAVLDWRMVERMRAEGRPVDDEGAQRTAERAVALTDEFLSDKARKAKADGQPLPADPWVSRWYQPQLRQIFDAVGAGGLYDAPYFMMSEWHHWSPGGLAQGMRGGDGTFSFNPRSPMTQAGALATSFQCLAETALLVGEHFDLAQVVGVAEIVNAYSSDERIADGPFGSAAP